MESAPRDRSWWLKRASWLVAFTVAWNVIEGVIGVAAGIIAGSVALIGFGLDSFIETTSALVVGWRLRVEMRGGSTEVVERTERRASRIAGGLLLLLAAYLLVDAGRRLLGLGEHAEGSPVGIALTAISLVVMPILGRAKLRAARELDSRALRADAFETISCAWLSATTLLGLLLNMTLGWWWADPIAAVVLVPLIVREGLEGFRSESCCCECSGDERGEKPPKA